MPALFYKEWLKLRPVLALLIAGTLAFSVYLFLSVRHQFRIEHAEMLYYQANHIGRLFYEDLRYVPLVTGVILAVAQILPEVQRGRLRLSLHLPIGLAPLVLAHLLIGLAALGVILALDLAVLALTIGTFFPAAFVASAVTTALPWMLAGVAAYLGGALALLEPDRRVQAANLVVTAGVVWLCHLSRQYGAYDHALWGLAGLVALMAPAVLLPAHRFRDGGGR
ncbi:hypothetical protein [Roseospira visakhapatnamensis]|uniref:Uncharacterized protein n=1 Tax=Roseospira visakhapatnamensis TaxID=390880 RepID=A0A7W6WA59_9PROT|nr:hypothetical protein [Roseospira visakhapatnamensis]MBB4266523.1 hypothetical protein [Roseospira visakhapatnamensis]